MGNQLKTNWGFIEPLYRAGGLSNHELARQYGHHHASSVNYQRAITEGAIRAHAKKHRWQRDLADRVKHKTTEALIRGALRQEEGKAPSDDEIVEAAAATRAQVIRLHRDDLQALRNHEMELERRLQDNEDQVVIGWYEGAASEHNVKIGMLERAKILRELSTARHKRITLERMAWGIDDKNKAPADGVDVHLYLGGKDDET